MFDAFGIIGLIAGAKQLIKEATEKPVPAEYWNNKDLMHKDKMNPDVSPQQMENIVVLKSFQRNMKCLLNLLWIRSGTIMMLECMEKK